MENILCCYFCCYLSPFYQMVWSNQKAPIPVSSKWHLSFQEAVTLALISLSQAQLIQWFRFSFNQPNIKGCSQRLLGVTKNLPNQVLFNNIPESLPAKLKKGPSPHEVRLTLLKNNPVFLREWPMLHLFFCVYLKIFQLTNFSRWL